MKVIEVGFGSGDSRETHQDAADSGASGFFGWGTIGDRRPIPFANAEEWPLTRGILDYRKCH
jgi:hypothetical protein